MESLESCFLYSSCFIIGLVAGYKLKKPITLAARIYSQGPTKLVLVVREDLKMGKGKLVAQCCHGTLNSYKEAPNRTVLTSWEWSGQPKVVVKVKSLEELLQIKEIAEKLHVPSCLVRDAGRTQIAPGTETVLSVGPDVISKIDEVTGHLKLL